MLLYKKNTKKHDKVSQSGFWMDLSHPIQRQKTIRCLWTSRSWWSSRSNSAFRAFFFACDVSSYESIVFFFFFYKLIHDDVIETRIKMSNTQWYHDFVHLCSIIFIDIFLDIYMSNKNIIEVPASALGAACHVGRNCNGSVFLRNL